MPLRELAFQSAGSTLRGILHDAGPGPALLCIHGLTLSHEMFAELGTRCEAAGISLFRFHLRGHGDSEGELAQQGFFDELADCEAALDVLKRESKAGERIGVLGFSIGGALAAMLSERMPLKVLATWASLFDTSRWKKARNEEYGEEEDGIVKIWDGIAVSSRLFSEAIECDPFAVALRFPGPFFAAHGGRDRNHPQSKSMELIERRHALGLKAEGYFPERSGHKFQVAEDWAELQKRSLAFFKGEL